MEEELEFHGGHFESQNVCATINEQLQNIWRQLNRNQQTIAGSYLSLLNCNHISSIFRTIISSKYEQPDPNFDPEIVWANPTLTIEFDQQGPALVLEYDITVTLNQSNDQKIELYERAMDFWGVNYTPYSGSGDVTADWFNSVKNAQNKAGIVLENKIVEAMREARQSTQAVHDFIPPPGIFLATPINTVSAVITEGGPGEEGGGPLEGGDFPEHGGAAEEFA